MDFTSNDQPAVHATNTSTGGAIFADGTSGPGLASASAKSSAPPGSGRRYRKQEIFVAAAVFFSARANYSGFQIFR